MSIRDIKQLARPIKHYNTSLEVHYQLQYDLASGEAISAEALLRRKNVGARSAPDKLIADAEADGSINSLTLWVINRALRDFPFLSRYQKIDRIAVNVSASDITRRGFILEVARLLEQHGIHGSCLELEITERMPIVKISLAIANIQVAKKLGMRVVLDDFGTGYTSLPSLIHLPIDGIKLDKCFSANIADHKHTAVALSIVKLSKELSLSVIMEGVESKTIQSEAESLGCHMGQGYYFHKPEALPGLIKPYTEVSKSNVIQLFS
jgi:EAL domain-containing protein (putative c-di-GMP-specific phosphodiesterase class I)